MPSSRERALLLKARAAEETLERALAATRAAAWTLDLRTGRITRSVSAVELYGVRRPSDIGRGTQLVHPADRRHYKAVVAHAIRRRGAYTVVFRLVRPRDGRVLWLEESGRVLVPKGRGEAGVLSGLVVDVTDKHAAEQRRRLQSSLRSIFRESPTLEEALAQALRLAGEEFDWTAGFAWRLRPALEAFEMAESWTAAGARPRRLAAATRHARLRRGEGLAGLAWARGRGSWTADLGALIEPRRSAAQADGLGVAFAAPITGKRRIIGALEFFGRKEAASSASDAETLEGFCAQLGQQIERRQAEDSLERQRREQQLILDSVPAMIWFKDSENRVLRCNRAAAKWYGKAPSEIEGRTAALLFDGERGRQYHLDDLGVLRSGRPKLGRFEECVSPRGLSCWVRRDIIPYEDEAGRRGVIIFAVDVTEVKRAEAILQENERQKEFVANVSHELRTPVAAIKGFAETLRRGAIDDPSNRRRFVRIIESHADRLGHLIEELLTLSALDGGRGLARRPVCLAELAGEHVAALEPLFARKSIKPSLALRPVKVDGDPLYLKQLLDNLLSNALKYSPAGRRVLVSTRQEASAAVLRVADEGIGIAPEHRQRIFERFFRAEQTTGRGHSGLGLHIVKRIVDAHGGEISVESAPGRGSTFAVRLPLA